MALVTASGFVGEVLLTQGAEVVEADHPVTVAERPSKTTTFSRWGSSDLCSLSLADLLVVLGEDHAALGVGEDVGDVRGVRRGVDRRGRATRRTSPRGRRGSTRRGCPMRCRLAARTRCPGRAARRRASRPCRRSPSRSATPRAGRPRRGSCRPPGRGSCATRSRNCTATFGGAVLDEGGVGVDGRHGSAPGWARTGPGRGPRVR